jgi:hypothetical protein
MQGDSDHVSWDPTLIKYLEPSPLRLSVPAPLPPSSAAHVPASAKPASGQQQDQQVAELDLVDLVNAEELYPFLRPERQQVSALLKSDESESARALVNARIEANSAVEWRRSDSIALYDPVRNPLFHLAASGVVTDEQLYSCGFVDGDHHLRTFDGLSR